MPKARSNAGTTATNEQKTEGVTVQNNESEVKPNEQPQTGDAGEQNQSSTDQTPRDESKSEIKTDENADAGQSETTDPADDSAEAEDEIKSGFEKISVRALCDDGNPFTGTYGTMFFNAEGVTEVTIADRDSLEKLQKQFPTLDIKQA